MEFQQFLVVRLKNVINDKGKQRILKNFFSLSGLQIANYIFPFITLPYLVRVLGPEKYGLLAFAQSFIGYFQILTNYGFNLSATQEIAINRADKGKINEIFSSVILIQIGMSILSFIIMSIIVFSISRFRTEWLIYYLTFSSIFSQIFFPSWLFQGMENMSFITLINILSKLVFTISIFFFVKTSSDYYFVPLLNLIGGVIASIVSVYLIFNFFQIRFHKPTILQLKHQLRNGWHIFISQLAISLYTVSNSFILGLFTNNTIVGYYAAAEKVIKALQGAYSPISQSIYPFVNNLMIKSKEEVLSFLRKLIYFVGSASFIVSLALFLFSNLFIHIILGDSFHRSVQVLRILAFLPFIILLSNFFGIQIMLTFGYKKQFSAIVIAASIINIFLLLILSPLFYEIGTACSVLISELFVTITMAIFLKKKGLLIV